MFVEQNNGVNMLNSPHSKVCKLIEELPYKDELEVIQSIKQIKLLLRQLNEPTQTQFDLQNLQIMLQPFEDVKKRESLEWPILRELVSVAEYFLGFQVVPTQLVAVAKTLVGLAHRIIQEEDASVHAELMLCIVRVLARVVVVGGAQICRSLLAWQAPLTEAERKNGLKPQRIMNILFHSMCCFPELVPLQGFACMGEFCL
jgi:hypothetical protein